MLFLDGVYLIDREPPVFRRLSAPRPQALEQLIHTINQRVDAYLEREGLLVRDIENTYLQLETSDESAMSDLLGHSVTYRTAVGPPGWAQGIHVVNRARRGRRKRKYTFSAGTSLARPWPPTD